VRLYGRQERRLWMHEKEEVMRNRVNLNKIAAKCKLPEGYVALWHAVLRCDNFYIPITSEQVDRMIYWGEWVVNCPTREGESASIRITIPCYCIQRESRPEDGPEYLNHYSVDESSVDCDITRSGVRIGCDGYEGRDYAIMESVVIDGVLTHPRKSYQYTTSDLKGCIFGWGSLDHYFSYDAVVEAYNGKQMLIYDSLIEDYEGCLESLKEHHERIAKGEETYYSESSVKHLEDTILKYKPLVNERLRNAE
jgi:hypothetical protein